MPLSRNFYSFAIFLSGLFAAITLMQGIIYFLLAQQTYSLAIFFGWYLFGNGLSLLGAFIILRYFHLKAFYLAFWTLLVVTIASLIQFSTGLGAFTGMRELADYYMSAHLLVVGANIIFGLALIFSVAGKRYWLKLTGIFSMLLGVVLMAAGIWYFDSTLSEKLLLLEKIYKWPSLLGWVGPALIMMNFLSEQKQLRLEGEG
ncbi:MAG TPA: hypothetical protein VF141_07325, partial [Chryseolinea sp.]